MRFIVAAIVLVAGLSTAQDAHARVKCSAGATVAVAGPLRIFGIHFHEPRQNNLSGWHEYACLNGHGPARRVGVDEGNAGAYENRTTTYVFAGARYLAAYDEQASEGGGYSELRIIDLRTGRGWSPDVEVLSDADFLAGSHGELITSELHRTGTSADGLTLRVTPRGGKPGKPLSTITQNVAVTGRTVYWTEHAGTSLQVVRSAALPGVAADGEPLVLPTVPVYSSGCGSRHGVTVGRVGRVRVARHAGAYFACRVGRSGAISLPAGTRPATLRVAGDRHRDDQPALAGDRWLLAQDACSARVIDMDRLQVVTTVAPFEPGWRETLLNDGTLAWTDEAGALFVRPPGGETAPLATGASALATSGDTVYWTAGGAPQAASGVALGEAASAATMRRRISSAPATAPAAASPAPASSAVCRPST
jgi:hypothetical protein